jgi:hypothetical protein
MKLCFLFLLSLFYIHQPLSNRLMPEEDVIFADGSIYYIIPSKSPTFIPPLVLNFAYRMALDSGPHFGEAVFSGKDDLINYLNNTDLMDMQAKDKELYLRALALYYIWISEKKADPIPELHEALEKLGKEKDSKIKGFASLIKKIL